MNFHLAVNVAEVILWGGISLAFVIRAILSKHTYWRSLSWWAALAFGLFAVSDAIEITTEAWWRPWWLLVLKVACLVMFAGLFWDYTRHKKRTTSE